MADKSAVASGSDSWVVSIEKALDEELKWIVQGGAKETRTTKCSVFRIPKRVKDGLGVNDTTYTHGTDGISLGLFHRPGHYNAPKMGEAFKVKMAGAYLTTIFMNEERRKASLARLADNNPAIKDQDLEGRPNVDGGVKSVKSSIKAIRDDRGLRDQVWRDLCNEVVGGDEGLKLTKQRYLLEDDDQVGENESEEVLKCALTLDAITVATGLCIVHLEKGHEMFPFEFFHEHLERSTEVGKKSKTAVFRFHMDFIKLENQIPLPLLRRVMRILHNEAKDPSSEGVEQSKGDAALNLACSEFARDLSNRFLPGCDKQLTKVYMDCMTEKMMFLNCDHPLGCISHVLSSESRRIVEEHQKLASRESSKRKRPSWIRTFIDPFRGRYVGGFTEDKGKSHQPSGIGSYLRNCFFRSKSSALGSGTSKTFNTPILNLESWRNIEEQKNLESGPSSGVSRVSWVSRRLRNSFFYPHNENSVRSGSAKARNFSVPCATRLQEAGIEFRNRANIHNCDLLPVFVPGWFKATLYIPRLPRLTGLTLVIWKNLVAYESRAVHSYSQSESQFLALLGFLDSLIDTKEDVMLMTQGRDPVLPDRYSTVPEDMARTFNTILTGYPVPEYPQWLALKKTIVDYHNQKWRRMVLDFIRANFGKPWLIISVFAATVLLVLTTLQTGWRTADISPLYPPSPAFNRYFSPAIDGTVAALSPISKRTASFFSPRSLFEENCKIFPRTFLKAKLLGEGQRKTFWTESMT